MRESCKVEVAPAKDVPSIITIDELCAENPKRIQLIEEAVRASEAYLISHGGELVGYAIMTQNFFQRPFVEMLYIANDKRRQGLGEIAMIALESMTKDANEIWTSTNRSNIAMQSLLVKIGYVQAGEVEIDRGDPEIFYRKELAK
jgi:ribosomal protein S18 acetylase RimI-like enzyme